MENKNQTYKKDNGKERVDLIEPILFYEIAKVLGYGAAKYEAGSWKKVDDPINRYYASSLRHLLAWRNGESIDKESGLKHLSHAITNIMFLLYFEKIKEDKNERKL